jgi:hypothetical protein
MAKKKKKRFVPRPIAAILETITLCAPLCRNKNVICFARSCDVAFLKYNYFLGLGLL